MDATRSNSIRQWAQQVYGPPSRTAANTRDLIEELVRANRRRDSSKFGCTSPSQQTLFQGDASSDGASTLWYDETWNDDDFYGAMTPGTTPESSSTNDPTTDESSATDSSTIPTSLASKERGTVGPAEPPPGILMEPCMYNKLSRIEQLEYLIRLKIMIFRQQLGVPCVFRNMQLWNIDWEERNRRRKFFEKNGDEAYLACYINSDYVGRVEFHYIHPEEVY